MSRSKNDVNRQRFGAGQGGLRWEWERKEKVEEEKRDMWKNRLEVSCNRMRDHLCSEKRLIEKVKQMMEKEERYRMKNRVKRNER